MRPWQRRMRWTAVGTDAASAAICAVVCALTLSVSTGTVFVVAVVAAAGWAAAISAARGYDTWRLGAGPEEFQSLLRATAWLMAVIALLSYLGRAEIPRRVVLIAIPAAALLSAICRYAARRVLHHHRRAGQASLRTLLVGDAGSVADLQVSLDRERHYGYHVVGVCSNSRATEITPALGAIADIPQVVVDQDIDVVVVASGQLRSQAVRRLSWALEHTQAKLVVAPGLVEVMAPRVVVRPTAGLSLLHVECSGGGRGRRVAKGCLDYSLGVVLTLAATPVIAIAALAVRFTSRGPAFFPQTRIGQDGLPFTMYKLRTMTVDADRQRAPLLGSSDCDGLMFKMRSDPRVTPVGRVLRRFSVDELPQLWNVVRGEMSLVGPRPPLAEEHDRYHDQVFRRLRVRPGLTGLWQVSGRADLPWEEAIRLDLRYVDNWSVTMDLFILWKTGRSVLTGSGAY